MDDDLNIRVLRGGRQDNIRIISESAYHRDGTDLPPSPFHFLAEHKVWGQPERANARISLDQRVHQQIMEHARWGTHRQRVEVGGVLLGRAYRSQTGRGYDVSVEEALRDQLGVGRAASYAFTHESWAALVKEAETKFPNLRIIGWYHSHPDYGAFYSETDRTTQRTYFRTPWRVGIVVDSIRDEGKLFTVGENGDEVIDLPGFYERLDTHRETITWTNWRNAQVQATSGPELPIIIHKPPRKLPDWIMGIAFLVMILAFIVLLLQLQSQLDNIRSDIRELRATLSAVNAKVGLDMPEAAKSPPKLDMPNLVPTPKSLPDSMRTSIPPSLPNLILTIISPHP